MVRALNFLRKPATVGFLVFAAILIGIQLFVYQRYLLVKTQKIRELTNAAEVVKERMDATFSSGLAAASSLGLMVRHYGTRDFEKVAQDILEQNGNVDGLSLIEGETVTHVYPLAGNQAYLGHNVFRDTVSNWELRRSLANRSFYFAGPYKLIQGGQGIIARMPIFIDNKYYGFATALIKLSTFLKPADAGSPYNRLYVFQISRTDPKTHQEMFFLPVNESFDLNAGMQAAVQEGDWTIHARFAKPLPYWVLYVSVVTGFLFAAVAGLLGWYIAKQPFELRKLVEEKMNLLKESEMEYASLFQQANDAILVMDNGGAIIDVNESLCSLLQYSKEALLEMRVEDLVDPEQLRQMPVAYEAVLKGDLLSTDRRLVKRDGEMAEMELSAKKIKENRILIIGRDVTEQRKGQKQIALSESTLRSAFDYSPLGNCLVSLEGAFLKTNRKLSEMLGYSEAEFLDLEFKDIIHPADLNMDLPGLARAQMDFPASAGNELRYICKDGSVIWTNLIVSLVQGPANEPLFYVCQIENITRVKLLAKDLTERVKELQCLYSLSEASASQGRSMEEVISAFIESIPPAYQYPDMACARIIFNDKVFQTKFFQESAWKQKAPIISGSQRVGAVEVFYTSEREEEWEGPFLKEERHLITTVADMLGTYADRQKVQSELSQSEEKFRTLVEQSLASVFIYQDDHFIYVNPAFEAASGYNRAQLIRRMSMEQLVHDDDQAMLRESYEAKMEGAGLSDHYVVRIIRSDGALRQIEMVLSSIMYNDAPAVIGTIIDVTERMEEEKRIERAVTEAQEKERLQIGMELHDNVKQILAATKFRLSALVSSLHDREEAYRIIDDLKTNIASAIHELRRLSHQLAPSVESSWSLADKIRSLADDMNSAKTLSISINIDEPSERLNEHVQLALYRILQEQLVNIIKYAEATQVGIEIRSIDEGVHMRIGDNGKGFDTSIRKAGIGLENIRRRTQFLDGRVDIMSAPGAGTQLTVYIPGCLLDESVAASEREALS